MQKYIQQTEPVPVKYDQVIEDGENLVGIMYFPPGGAEKQFELRVNGNREWVLDYQNAKVLELSVTPIEDLPQSWPQATSEEAAERRRKYWRAVLEELGQAVEQAKPEELDTPEFLCNKACQIKRPLDCRDFRAETLQRQVSVRPVGLAAGRRYGMKFVIDPHVEAGKRDVYVPPSQATSSVNINCATANGDPDLYLYRGGTLKDWSLNGTGAAEAVGAAGGAGSWELHVHAYGANDASYTLDVSWILVADG